MNKPRSRTRQLNTVKPFRLAPRSDALIADSPSLLWSDYVSIITMCRRPRSRCRSSAHQRQIVQLKFAKYITPKLVDHRQRSDARDQGARRNVEMGHH